MYVTAQMKSGLLYAKGSIIAFPFLGREKCDVFMKAYYY